MISLEDFLEQVSLVADADEIPDTEEAEQAGVVTLMTLHTAKGLEFPVVFLTGMEDGTFPHLRSLGDPKELEEERRLAYVGITRARERLHLSRAAVRSAWGAPQYNPPSRFLDEIPAELVEWERELSGAAAIGRRDQRPAVATLAARPGVRSPGNRPVIPLSPGDRVTHDSYGLGTVVRTLGEGDKTQAEVDFGGELGVKRLRAALRAAREALTAAVSATSAPTQGVRRGRLRSSPCCAQPRHRVDRAVASVALFWISRCRCEPKEWPVLPTRPTSSPGMTVSPFWAIRLLMWPYQEIDAVPVADLDLVAEAGVEERADDLALGHRVERGAGGGAEVDAVVGLAPAPAEAGGDVPGADRAHPALALALGLGLGAAALRWAVRAAPGGLLGAALEGGGLDRRGLATLREVGDHRVVRGLLGAGHGGLGAVELEGRGCGVHDRRSGRGHHERRGRRSGQHEARAERSGQTGTT